MTGEKKALVIHESVSLECEANRHEQLVFSITFFGISFLFTFGVELSVRVITFGFSLHFFGTL